MKKKHWILFFMIVFFAKTEAQQFLTPSSSFSHKDTAYLTLADGSGIKGRIKNIDRKKGLIELIEIEVASGKVQEYKATSIQSMYLPPSGFDIMNKATGFLSDVQKWNDEKLDQDLLNSNYAYFDCSKVIIKGKEMVLLLQLLNPSFSKKVKVYFDPYAGDSSMGTGGFTVEGGAKSYYIKVGDEPAYKLQKKNYKEEFMRLWSSCNKVVKQYKNMKWDELPDHIAAFSECD